MKTTQRIKRTKGFPPVMISILIILSATLFIVGCTSIPKQNVNVATSQKLVLTKSVIMDSGDIEDYAVFGNSIFMLKGTSVFEENIKTKEEHLLQNFSSQTSLARASFAGNEKIAAWLLWENSTSDVTLTIFDISDNSIISSFFVYKAGADRLFYPIHITLDNNILYANKTRIFLYDIQNMQNHHVSDITSLIDLNKQGPEMDEIGDFLDDNFMVFSKNNSYHIYGSVYLYNIKSNRSILLSNDTFTQYYPVYKLHDDVLLEKRIMFNNGKSYYFISINDRKLRDVGSQDASSFIRKATGKRYFVDDTCSNLTSYDNISLTAQIPGSSSISNERCFVYGSSVFWTNYDFNSNISTLSKVDINQE